MRDHLRFLIKSHRKILEKTVFSALYGLSMAFCPPLPLKPSPKNPKEHQNHVKLSSDNSLLLVKSQERCSPYKASMPVAMYRALLPTVLDFRVPAGKLNKHMLEMTPARDPKQRIKTKKRRTWILGSGRGLNG